MAPSTPSAPKATPEETEDLRKFREAWRAEVRKKKGGAGAGTSLDQEKATTKPPEDAGLGRAPINPRPNPELLPGPSNETIAGPSEEQSRPTSHLAAAIAYNTTASPAVAIYRQAVLQEQKGDLDEALSLYRQAFRREPNVDKLYHQEERLGAFLAGQTQIQKGTQEAITSSGKKKDTIDPLAVELLSENVKHTLAFQEKTAEAAEKAHHRRRSSGGTSNTSRLASILKEFPEQLVFEPEDEKEPVHLNLLPDEMVVQVIKNLDPASIERFAAVNRKARLVSLDSTIWRELVDSTYKPPQIPQEDVLHELYDQYLFDYRRLYIEHPRVRLDGVYIAVCHYVRQGLHENSWVNLSHFITYRRYLRFYPNGQVLSLLTNEEQSPAEVIPRLKPTRATKGLFVGTWHLSGTTIILSNLIDSASLSDQTLAPVDLSSPSSVLAAINHAHRSTHNQAGHTTAASSHNRPVAEHPLRYVFTMTLSLRSRPLGRWNKLDMASYDSVNLETGDVYPVALKHERPFWFSKVKSYAHY
ncbi:hypothetical protein V5O48_005713 [Marasmius crinis-equi]|uniref:F-box domain-containing protein n=1 Tax=Marasmius crinis-equi TaxID=585013 RepID=A0ABR3FLM8_9AGAR